VRVEASALPRVAQRATSESSLRVGADSFQANTGRLGWAVDAISHSQWNDWFGVNSGPSRATPGRRAFRPKAMLAGSKNVGYCRPPFRPSGSVPGIDGEHAKACIGSTRQTIERQSGRPIHPTHGVVWEKSMAQLPRRGPPLLLKVLLQGSLRHRLQDGERLNLRIGRIGESLRATFSLDDMRTGGRPLD
jgi:hypothetical protein